MKNHQWTTMNQYSPRIDHILSQPLKIPSNCTMFFLNFNPWPEVSRSVATCEGPIPLPLAFATAWTSRCKLCVGQRWWMRRRPSICRSFYESTSFPHLSYGYGSVPINTILLREWTSIYQLFWCELQGYKVLTHCHICLLECNNCYISGEQNPHRHDFFCVSSDIWHRP